LKKEINKFESLEIDTKLKSLDLMKTKISYLTDEMKKYESDNLKTKFIALKDFIET
jgi:hypothetical protein